jgi:RNA polymerase sigma factor (sigma-70 family)
MPDEDHWRRLTDGLRAGDPRAEHEFWQRYGPALQRLAEKRLSPKLQARVGPEDVVQSARRTFLRRARGGEFQLPDSGALWQLLCAITLTKLAEQARFHSRRKRSITQETPLEHASADSSDAGDFDPVDPHGDPVDAVALADQLEQVLAMLDERERQIVDLKLQDLTNDDVAQRLNLSERTVRRTLKTLQARLTHALDEGVT